MDFTYSVEAEAFRSEVREWMQPRMDGEFAHLRARSTFSVGDWPDLVRWEKEMGEGGWVGLSWPKEFGGRAAAPVEELVFAEEYARADAPNRAGVFGEGLLGPTLMLFGTDEQRQRFLPPILRGEEFWCQGFSEPGAGSDLGNLATRAVLDGDTWIVDGQKLWTSYAQNAQWIFVLCRTEPDEPKHRGISMLLVPLDQPGVDVRPLVEMTGGNHFCEVFFDGARTAGENIVGDRGEGWKIAMATLGFERGTSFLGTLIRFGRELERLIDVARQGNGAADRLTRQRLAGAYAELQVMRYGAFRTITELIDKGQPGPEASIGKLQWSQWHQRLGELAIDIHGAAATVIDDTDRARIDAQHGFLFSRAHTIYAGSSEVQRNIIGERVLGLPRG